MSSSRAQRRATTPTTLSPETRALKRESEDLRHLVADLSLDLHCLKKTSIPGLGEGGSSSGDGGVIPRLQAQGSVRAWSIQERLLPLERQTETGKP